jgi:hypothetical protein
VRDAWSESGEERGAGRNRHLARRSAGLIETVLRLALAIIADAGAFLLWNLASRSPARLVRDLATGFSRPSTALLAVARTTGGFTLLVIGAALVLPLSIQLRTFTVLETWTVLTGLLVEQLIGADLRRAPRA